MDILFRRPSFELNLDKASVCLSAPLVYVYHNDGPILKLRVWWLTKCAAPHMHHSTSGLQQRQ